MPCRRCRASQLRRRRTYFVRLFPFLRTSANCMSLTQKRNRSIRCLQIQREPHTSSASFTQSARAESHARSRYVVLVSETCGGSSASRRAHRTPGRLDLVRQGKTMELGFPSPGGSTAEQPLVDHRLEKIAPITGRWLDYGCADGGYAAGLLDTGAERVIGVDVVPERIAQAGERDSLGGRLEFLCVQDDRLPFEDSTFDGVLINEVLEHVIDERRTLSEVARVLRPNGRLVLFSPNRFFPVEGHGLRFSQTSAIRRPVPLVPWFPARLTSRFMQARNYWPWQLRRLVCNAGFEICSLGTVFPQFALYLALPERIGSAYRRRIATVERTPLIRWFGVSVFIDARKRAGDVNH
jgi:SAM-dependent methyltransferase